MATIEDSLEAFLEPFWIKDDGKTLCRGRMIQAVLPHAMPEQAWLEVEGRQSPTDHTKALYSVKSPLRFADAKNAARRGEGLPVAALSQYQNEVYLVQRAKVRWALVMGVEIPEIPKALRQGETSRWTQPTIVVAPSYGTGEGKSAPGPEFLKRIRRCEYPNYFFLSIPGQTQHSVVRLDQMQPIGRHYQNYRISEYRLSDDVLLVLDQWMQWLLSGAIAEDELLETLRDGLLALP